MSARNATDCVLKKLNAVDFPPETVNRFKNQTCLVFFFSRGKNAFRGFFLFVFLFFGFCFFDLKS